MHIPAVYRQRIESAPPRPEPIKPKLHEELADLAYQLVKLYAVEYQLIGVEILTWWNAHGQDPLGWSFEQAYGLARQGQQPALSALLDPFGEELPAEFLQVQRLAVLARRHRGESGDGWQSEAYLRDKVVEEFGEVCQYLPELPKEQCWLRKLAPAVSECLFRNTPEAARHGLEVIQACARDQVVSSLSLGLLLKFVNLKMLGRMEWNFQGWSQEQVKLHAPKAEERLLATFQRPKAQSGER